MTDTNGGQHLHDRATRGLSLTAEERAALAEWYRHQDAQEQQALANEPRSESLFRLKGEIRAAVKELRNLAEQIEQLSAENARLSGEVIALENAVFAQTATSRA